MRGRVVMIEASAGRGGPPMTVLQLAGELARRREVIVAIRPGEVADRIAETTRASVARLDPSRWAATKELHRMLRDADVIHANGKSALNLVAPAAPRRPVFMHFHDSALTSRNQALLRAWGFAVDAHVAPVSELAGSLLHMRCRVLPVLPTPIPAPSGRARFGGRSVAVVASSSWNKGLDRVAAVAERLPDVEWHVYGFSRENSYTAACREALRPFDVVWHGRRPDLPELLATHNAALLASRRESFGRVAIEAMAAGLPVVVADNPGVREACGSAARLWATADEAAVHLDAVLSRRAEFEAAQRAGLARAAHFEPSRVCDRLEVLYGSMTGDPIA